jgi:hypothetical protein
MKFTSILLILLVGLSYSLTSYSSPQQIQRIESEMRWERRKLNSCKENTCFYQAVRCRSGDIPGIKKRCKKWWNIFEVGVSKCLKEVCGKSEIECHGDCEENYNTTIAGLQAQLDILRKGKKRKRRRRRRREPKPRPEPTPPPKPDVVDIAPCVDDCTFALFQCRKLAGRSQQKRRECKHKNISCKNDCRS